VLERVELVDAIAACMLAGDEAILAGLALMHEAQQRDLQNFSSRPAESRMRCLPV
jgi:hypothetical protein